MSATTDRRTLLEIAQSYSKPGLSVTVSIRGLPPGYIQRNPESMLLQAAATEAHRTGGKRTKFIPEHDQESEWSTYRLPDGSLCLPTHAFHRSLVEAAKEFTVPKRRMSFRERVAAGVRVPGGVEFGWPLVHPETGKVLSEFEAFVARVVVSKQAVFRARPRIQEWMSTITLDVDPEAVSTEVLAEVVGLAGSRKGIGDWRPEKGGVHGRFEVVSFDVVGTMLEIPAEAEEEPVSTGKRKKA